MSHLSVYKPDMTRDEPMTATIKIAQWTFSPETGQLENGVDSTRLEHRAAALLDLLAREPGRLVSHAEIIDNVWDGRSVSPNSVAVVISDLRRALGDDPKAPKFVETLPKRGYRLVAETSGAAPSSRPTDTETVTARPRVPILALAALPLIAVMIFFVGRVFPAAPAGAGVEPVRVTVSAAVNETGDAQYDPLTASVTELLSVQLAQHDSLKLSPSTNASIIVTGKLILWDGHPSMSIYAQSAETGDVIWSGMASGPETMLPRQVRHEITEFAEFAGQTDPDG